MSSKARRPYLIGKESVGDFYKSDVRFLKEVVGRESEFEKPYEDEDYRKMHFDFPWPDWPPFPPRSPWPPLPPIDGPVPGLTLCGITCYAPSDCDEPIWCHPSIWCGTDLGCTLCSWIVEGATSGYSPHLTGVGSWGIDVWIDATLVESGGEALIHVQMTDPCGNLCGKDIEVTCKVCPPDVVMTWDTAAETIAQSDTLLVSIKDGQGDYEWSVSGTGFSMLHATTVGVSNTLQSDATACGVATITVTDYCEDTVTGYVRCTEGVWSEITFDSCTISGDVTEGDNATRIEGKYKLYELWSSIASCETCWCSEIDTAAGQCTDAACHAAMGCTRCLNHGTEYCSDYLDGDNPCETTSTFFCCCNSDGCANTTCRAYCSRTTSKLYEWIC